MRLRSAITLVSAISLLAACNGRTDRAGPPTTTTPPARVTPSLLPLRVVRDDRPRVVDAESREVILRGVNLNSLAEYHQADPDLPPVVPVTDTDWDEMAAQGFNVVRLLVSWSSLEPERGAFDRAYVDRIRAAVDDAAARGMYTVIDMHQDAWGAHIATPDGTVCPEGREPAIGWDGAPAWATPSHGPTDTCRAGSRENSPAVQAAWDAFYTNADGVMDALVATWGRLAGEFADRAEVAGFDLLNEPNHGTDVDRARAGLARYYGLAIGAIRAAEGTDGIRHFVFIEPTVAAVPVDAGFTDDDQIVFAPHHYGESISPLPIDGVFDYLAALAATYPAPLWIGEYGWFDDTAQNGDRLARYAAKEDALLTAGSAWWQWRQACGDPHSIGTPGGAPAPTQVHYRRNRCPGDRDGGVVKRWACLRRTYPRAAPGRLRSIRTDCGANATIDGVATAAGRLDLWVPGSVRPDVSGTGLDAVEVREVPGGWRVSATVEGDWSVTTRV